MKTMKTRIACCVATVLALIAFAAPSMGNLDYDNLTYQIPELAPYEVGPARFDHDQHMEIEEDCTYCHHVYEDGVKVEGESSEGIPCADCHLVEATDENPLALRRAMHMNCMNCHERENKGPLSCSGCHVEP